MPLTKDSFVFHFPISEYDKRKYKFVVMRLAKKMKDKFAFDIYENLGKYHVYHFSDPSEDLKKYNAAGIAYYNGDIAVAYYGDYGSWYVSFDIHIAAMELAHISMLRMLPGVKYIEEFNNLPHYGSNAAQHGIRNYLPTKEIHFRTLKEFFMGKPREKIIIEYYDIIKLLINMGRINKEIREGIAYTGKDPYWNFNDVALSKQVFKDGIIPGSICSVMH